MSIVEHQRLCARCSGVGTVHQRDRLGVLRETRCPRCDGAGRRPWACNVEASRRGGLTAQRRRRASGARLKAGGAE